MSIQVKPRNSLVKVVKDNPMVGTLSIAKGFGRKHAYVVELIDKYKSDFKSFATVKVSNPDRQKNGLLIKLHKTRGGGKPVVEYLLNKEQAMFLGTLFRNSRVVVDFKRELIRAFGEMERALLNLQKEKMKPEWHLARLDGKATRKDTTDVIRRFIEYAEAQGSTNADKYYMNISRMINHQLFYVDAGVVSVRDSMTNKQLMIVSVAEGVVMKALEEGMATGKAYKDIYVDAREKIRSLADLHGMSDVVDKQLKLL